jgi:hypothetical protein
MRLVEIATGCYAVYMRNERGQEFLLTIASLTMDLKGIMALPEGGD